MPYKDKDRQRVYQREWVRRKRQGSTGSTGRIKLKGQTPGITICQGITEGITQTVRPKPISDRGVLTLASGGHLGPLTKEQVQQAYDNLPDRDTSLPRANRQPLTKEQQVSKLGFNT